MVSLEGEREREKLFSKKESNLDKEASQMNPYNNCNNNNNNLLRTKTNRSHVERIRRDWGWRVQMRPRCGREQALGLCVRERGYNSVTRWLDAFHALAIYNNDNLPNSKYFLTQIMF